jgi:hypothetical protein
MGVGLVNAVSIALFTMLVIIIAKIVSLKYPIKGVTELINTI